MIDSAIPVEARVGPGEARTILGCTSRQLRLLVEREQVSVYQVGTGLPKYDRREIEALAARSYRPAQAPVARRTQPENKAKRPTTRPRRERAAASR